MHYSQPYCSSPILILSAFSRRWEGGLLALLLQTKPLYDAALSLALWHRNATIRRDCVKGGANEEEDGEQGQEQGFRYEQQLYGRAIAGLRGRIEILSQKGPNEGIKDSIEVLACIVQLILLEVNFLDILQECFMVWLKSC
jgi:hypothetical protein